MSTPDLRALRAILAFSIVSTGLHYTHNFVAIEDYPGAGPITSTMTQVAIVVAWPLLTAVGLVGYRLYANGRRHAGRICLAIYSLTGLVTIGHFASGVPDIPPLFFATIFTDFIAGAAVLGFTVWSARSDARPAAAAR
jgi:hypothetical protein